MEQRLGSCTSAAKAVAREGNRIGHRTRSFCYRAWVAFYELGWRGYIGASVFIVILLVKGCDLWNG